MTDMSPENDQRNVTSIQIEALQEPAEKPKWRSLFYFTTRHHAALLALAALFTVASGVMVPMIAILLGKIFDAFSKFGARAITAEKLMHEVSTHCLYLVGLGAITWVLQCGYFAVWLVFGELQAKNARERLFSELLNRDLEWFETRDDGVTALLPRLQTQIWELQMATAQPLGSVLQNLVACLTALGIALYTSWRLTLVSVASIPICAGIVAFLSRKLQPSIQTHSEALSKASRLASTAISSVDTVKYFNGQSFETFKYVAAIRTVASKYLRQARFHALEIGCVQFMIFIMFVQGFWYGSHLVDTGVLGAGQVLTAFWASLQATKSIDQTMPHLIVLEKGRAASTTLRDVLENRVRRRHVRDMTGAISPTFCEGEIQMKDVTFAYPSRADCYVLRNASLSFPAGDTTFVVGKSGSGKSTLGNLLMRFYTVRSGEILIDGHPIQTLSLDWIRNNITLVQQQSVLFNETIFRNIAFGSKDYGNVTQTQILKCLDFASLHNTIRNQPRGLDTNVGVGGTSLSGGQRQRVALARARLRDTPVLILDESTSALDYTARTLIMDAIRTWRKGKTTIIITHDMSQIRDEDFVYIVEAGEVTHKGYKHILTSRFGDMSVAADMESPPPYDGTADVKETEMQHFRFGSSIARTTGGRNRHNLSIAVARRESSILSHPATGQEFSLQDFSSPLLSAGPHRRPQFRNAPNILSAIEPVETSSSSEISPQAARRKSYSIPSANHIELAELYSARTLSPNFSIRTPQRSATSSSFYTASDDDFDIKTDSPRAREPRRYSSVHSVLFTVFPSLTPLEKCLLILGFVAALVHAAATPLFSYFFSQLLGTFFLTENRSREATKWSLLLIVDSVANALGSFSMNYLLERCGEAWINKLREEAMRRILSQPREWFEREENKASGLIASLDRSAEEMRNLVGKFAGFIFVAMVIMIMSITWGTAICWKLALVGLACAPVLYGCTRAFEAVTSKWETRCNDASEVIAGVFSDTFLDIRTVRALTLEGYFHKKVLIASFKSLKLGFQRACYAGFFYGLSDSAIIFVYTLVFYYGAILASALAYTTKDILTVFSMLLFGMSNVNAVLMFVPQIGSSRDTASRVLRLATLSDSSSHEHRGNIKISHPTPVNFKDVNFTYPSRRERPVLHSFNLTVAENSCTAIIGPSGSGKSTIASLLLSLYPVDGSNESLNSISLGGLDISKIHVPTLRTLITIVPQQPTLFPVSIRENINYGLEESSSLNTTENIKNAAQAAGIDEFIASLPQGYDTMIGDGNVGLSGGQAQRLIIARALVRRPRILILDEATSNLDSESARLVRNTVTKLTVSEDKITVIIITHAKEMMEIADKVVVVDDGTVVEEGEYDELINRNGGELWKLLTSTLE